MDAFGREHVRTERFDEWRQRRRRGAHPIGQGGDVELDTFARIGGTLAIERQVQAILGEEYMREQCRPGASTRDWMRGRRRLGDALA
jgi:hypothetical protein